MYSKIYFILSNFPLHSAFKQLNKTKLVTYIRKGIFTSFYTTCTKILKKVS